MRENESKPANVIGIELWLLCQEGFTAREVARAVYKHYRQSIGKRHVHSDRDVASVLFYKKGHGFCVNYIRAMETLNGSSEICNIR